MSSADFNAISSRVDQLRREVTAMEQRYLAETNIMKRIDLADEQLGPLRAALGNELIKLQAASQG
ncbi:MAG TPA: hypothetical protein VG165_03175 [Solirubrobacteraceae bacterium]|jgi:hypothetical protein|nr:hypothetical protein [Solirubrobacteraceae bacterium]